MPNKDRAARTAYHKAWRAKNRDKLLAQQRERRLKRFGWKADEHRKQRYGIAGDLYRELVDAQGGTCAICGKPPETVLHIDHDHETGLFRGLLCRRCNRSIGLFGDDPALLRMAADYIDSRRGFVLRQVG